MRILTLADIHIGSIKDTSYMFKTITDIFDKELIENKTDLVVFCGDVFDRLFKVNEEYVTLSIEIMQYLARISRKKNVKVRFIYGTESHEVNQYKLFKPFFDDKRIDWKIYDTVTEEIIDDKKCLFIPEEYINSKYDHYKSTLYDENKSYDYIFGHGIIIEGMTMINQIDEKERKEKYVPSFKSNELSSKCKVCLFGHYHVAWDLDNVHYIGSLFRNKFGEEEDKRYIIIEDDNIISVKNDKAFIYKTYTLDENDECYNSTELFNNKIELIKSENKNIINGNNKGKIRIIFKPPRNNELLSSFRENVKNIIGDNNNFSYNIQMTTDDDEIEQKIIIEYDFILDKNLPIEEKVFRYIQKHYDINLSLNEIKEIMFDELKY